MIMHRTELAATDDLTVSLAAALGTKRSYVRLREKVNFLTAGIGSERPTDSARAQERSDKPWVTRDTMHR